MGNQEFETPQAALAHFGKLGMHWGIRNDGKPGSTRGPAAANPKPIDVEAHKKGMVDFLATKTPEQIQADGAKKLKEQQAQSFPSRKDEKQQQKADVVQKAADELGSKAKALEDLASTRPPGIRGTLLRANDLGKAQEFRSKEAGLAKKADQIREGKLTDNQKVLIGVGAAVAIGGLAIYGNNKYKDNKFGVTSESKKKDLDDNLATSHAEWQAIFGRDHPGKPSKLGYAGAVNGPPDGGFHHTLTSKSAWDIPEFTIPTGTVFQRLSDHPEDVSGYGNPRGAYATFLHNDKKLYGSSFEFGSSGYTVNFHAKGDTKVASLPTIMSHLAAIKQRDSPGVHTEKSLAQDYYNLAGAGWKSGDSVKLMDSLKASGFGAIVDHMDAGFMGDLPIVFFGDAHRGTSTPRTAKDQHVDSQGLLKVGGTYK